MNTKVKGQRDGGMPELNLDVTENSGYTFEEQVPQRFAQGWGGTQTRLPRGHLARRDASSEVKHARATKGSAD